jgi:hypothetical protein
MHFIQHLFFVPSVLFADLNILFSTLKKKASFYTKVKNITDLQKFQNRKSFRKKRFQFLENQKLKCIANYVSINNFCNSS